MSYCFDCLKGYFCNEENMVFPEPCEAGTFQRYTASPSCEMCLPGNKCPLMNMTEATPCEPGTYQPEYGDQSKQIFHFYLFIRKGILRTLPSEHILPVQQHDVLRSMSPWLHLSQLDSS